MTSPIGVNPNRISDTPPRGQCWVCDEPEVPAKVIGLIPAICSDECRREWVRMLDIGRLGSHCASTNNLGAPGADVFCRLSTEHEGDHSNGEWSWSWDDKTGTGVISLHIASKGLTA